MAAATERRVLGALGVGTAAEDVYRALLAKPGSSAGELQEATDLGPSRLRSALAELERNAMITRRGGTRTRFQPAPPDMVVEALISAREDELNQARLYARQLASLPPTPPEQLHVTELVEILSTREAVAERWMQMQQATREMVEVFARPPLAQSAPEEHESLQESLHGRGVVLRSIYDGEALRLPGTLEHIRRTAASGEQARVVSQLPLKLALFDRRIALIPLTQRDPDTMVDSGLLVHRSALLDALIALFDIYWQRGTAVSPETEASASRQDAAEGTVLTLLAGGLKDEAIARELGVSTHTVRRRIAAITGRLGVTTRFQAGLALGRQGWPQADSAQGIVFGLSGGDDQARL
jgi:sugar-specific transcriptional regulator TrmB/DNA-binding CsgD family transcriptional regulator